MLRPALLATAVAVMSAPAPAEAGAAFLPPLEVELGVASISTPDGDAVSATQLLVGVSWASLYPHPTPIDVSLGVISTFAADAPRTTAARRIGVPPPSAVDATGGFLDVALRVDRGRHWRTWAGVRGELMGTEGVGVLGGAGRVSFELWMPVAAGGRGGVLFGALAVSGWAEVGVRERPDRSLATIAAAGLGFRLPLVLASH